MDFYQTLLKQAVKVKRFAKGYGKQNAYSSYIEKIQYKSPEELRNLQAVSICELLTHAVENIPYYKHLKDDLGLKPETAFDDIKKFPVMTKEIIEKNRNDLITPGMAVTEKVETSGTMGNEIQVLNGKYFHTHAPDEFFNSRIGIVPGKSRLLLKTVNSRKKQEPGDVEYHFDKISRTYTISYAYMNRARLEFMARTMKEKKVSIVWGMTQAICQLAEYMEENGCEFDPPELVLCGGQMMTSRWKETIERIWKTRVYDRYGSAEAGNFANQCKEAIGYHYVPTVHYVEVLDDDMSPVAEGETGNIYITTLSKRVMPMIRYRQDDLVIYTEETCPCGCNFPIIKDILGKRREAVVTPDHTYMYLAPLDGIMKKNGEIKDYQIIQNGIDSLHINLVSETSINEDAIFQIENDLCTMLDYDMKISFEKVRSLRTMKGGKLLRIIPLGRTGEINELI